MKIRSDDIIRGHGYLTPGKWYIVTDVVIEPGNLGRGFWFSNDSGTTSFAVEFGSKHLIAGGKWIIEEDEQ